MKIRLMLFFKYYILCPRNVIHISFANDETFIDRHIDMDNSNKSIGMYVMWLIFDK